MKFQYKLCQPQSFLIRKKWYADMFNPLNCDVGLGHLSQPNAYLRTTNVFFISFFAWIISLGLSSNYLVECLYGS